MKIKPTLYLPVLIAVFLVIGIYIGRQLSYFSDINQAFYALSQNKKISNNKIDNLLRYIQEEYVDTVNLDSLSDKVVENILEQLDPHSGYIPAKDLASLTEGMEGNFDGIGIEFNILNDTITVVSAISGGPSEALGIQTGDRIVKVDGKNVCGIKITNEDVVKRLRGKKGTQVKVAIKRKSVREILNYTITRDAIPLYSMDVAYMVTPLTGYIKISRFAATTYKEYLEAFNKLKIKGMKSLILDLRGNPGGYLDAATKIADEFLSDGQMIVYTSGKARPKEEYKATINGSFEKGKLCVLIDEGSASASEIIAGAIQDNDRGTIIGRRSFGKGLVQEQSEFGDGSALRLTIARYYTPSGRCIQKPYEIGKQTHYYEEELERYQNGELYHADSIKTNEKEKYKTSKGRVVYGGGGITPDEFIPLDTSGRNKIINEVAYSGLFNKYAIHYCDNNRAKLKDKYPVFTIYQKEFEIDNMLLNDFESFVAIHKIKGKLPKNQSSLKLIKTQLKALIGRLLFKNEGYYPILLQEDKAIQKALEKMN
jgi:carboxyl-terminal processing protease